MTVIGVDCAGKVAGCCIRKDGEEIWCRADNTGLTHSQTLMPLIAEGFAQTGLAPVGVDAYGITAGPGSFTGLRIGLSLLKGLSLPVGTQVAPVSTLYALALGSGLTGSVVCALNARRGEVYWAAFAAGPAGCERLTEDAAQPVHELESTVRNLPGPVWLLGDGAFLLEEGLPGDIPLRRMDPKAELAAACTGAALAAEAAETEGGLVAAATARPEYLRLSQAERERKARLEAE